MEKRKKYFHGRRRRRSVVSFSAKLPDDVCCEAFRECVCVVKYSANPFSEIRESIVEMIENVRIEDWKQMEELVYCYIALNSAEVHHLVGDAFLSLCCCINPQYS